MQKSNKIGNQTSLPWFVWTLGVWQMKAVCEWTVAVWPLNMETPEVLELHRLGWHPSSTTY